MRGEWNRGYLALQTDALARASPICPVFRGTFNELLGKRFWASKSQVTYVREGVAAVVAKNERIMGRLSLIKQNRVMFLAWLPYSPGSLLPDGTFHTPPIVAAQPTARGEHLLQCACNLQNALTVLCLALLGNGKDGSNCPSQLQQTS